MQSVCGYSISEDTGIVVSGITKVLVGELVEEGKKSERLLPLLSMCIISSSNNFLFVCLKFIHIYCI